MKFRTAICAVVVTGSLATTSAAVTATPVTVSGPVAVAAARPGSSVAAAKKKPVAAVSATYTVLASGRVLVAITSNATKAQIKYRTAKNRKRTANKKIKEAPPS